MPVVNILYGSHCGAEAVVHSLAEKTRYTFYDDGILIAETGKRFGIDAGRMRKALSGKTSIFNKFTHEKERCLAYLECVVADCLQSDDILITGLAGLMVPRDMSHVLKVCLIADMKYRTGIAAAELNVSEKEAAKRLHREDDSLALWTESAVGQKDPWAPELYDILIPLNKVSGEDAARMVCDHLKNTVLTFSGNARRAVADFALAAQVKLKLASEGHDVAVSVREGTAAMEINKHVLMLASLEEELKRAALSVPGVLRAETKVGPGYYQSDVYRKFDFEVPPQARVLLVDDEREFVETLSERLQMRDYASAVVYGGEEALSIMEEDEPEVMVLDLKMPGIDGLEVLRQVKEKHPHVEVIVLTGHGSEEVRKLCLELGASAYLEKPVDIEKLTKAMQEAYKKVKKSAVKFS